jgi:hypothetical protein
LRWEQLGNYIDGPNRSLNIFLNECVKDSSDGSLLRGLRIAIADSLRDDPLLTQLGHFGDDLRVMRSAREIGSPGD